MALDFLRLGDCTFFGPALPEPYVRFEFEKALAKHKLLPNADGLAGQTLRDQWDILRRKLRDTSPISGPVAITNRILDPLVSRLGYAKLSPADSVLAREGDEAGGALMSTDSGAKLRCWAIDYDADLDAPTQRGHVYRFSPVRIAQRGLLASGERVGPITNGVELRLLLCDPARPDSHIEIDLNVWRLSRGLPDGYQLLLALASPAGVAALPEIVEDGGAERSGARPLCRRLLQRPKALAGGLRRGRWLAPRTQVLAAVSATRLLAGQAIGYSTNAGCPGTLYRRFWRRVRSLGDLC